MNTHPADWAEIAVATVRRVWTTTAARHPLPPLPADPSEWESAINGQRVPRVPGRDIGNSEYRLCLCAGVLLWYSSSTPESQDRYILREYTDHTKPKHKRKPLPSRETVFGNLLENLIESGANIYATPTKLVPLPRAEQCATPFTRDPDGSTRVVSSPCGQISRHVHGRCHHQAGQPWRETHGVELDAASGGYRDRRDRYLQQVSA